MFAVFGFDTAGYDQRYLHTSGQDVPPMHVDVRIFLTKYCKMYNRRVTSLPHHARDLHIWNIQSIRLPQTRMLMSRKCFEVRSLLKGCPNECLNLS